jgi:hypothetical protein
MVGTTFYVIYNYKVPLIPVNNTRQRYFIPELFPGKFIAPGSESDTLSSIADAQH